MSSSREDLVRALELAVAGEARNMLGAERAISPAFDEATGRVRLFQTLRIVEAIDRPGTQVSLEDARRLDPAASVGGDITVELPYDRDEKWSSLLLLPEEWSDFRRRAARVAKETVLRSVRVSPSGSP